MKTIEIYFEGVDYEIEVEADVRNQEFSFGSFDFGTHSDTKIIVENVKIESCKSFDDYGKEIEHENTDFIYSAVKKYVFENCEEFIYEHC